MERILEKYHRRLKTTELKFQRYLTPKIDWSDRLIGITGARGTGKTTLMLQYLKQNFGSDPTALYVSMDDLHFSQNTLSDFADSFYKNGGKYLFLDEIHNYPNWSREVKNINDNYQELKLAFTGSSALRIYQGTADLSRRVMSYELHGLSFREFVELEYGVKIPLVDLQTLLKNHVEIAHDLASKIRPLALFNEYLTYGYYPFFKENKRNYLDRLEKVINQVLAVDVPAVHNLDQNSIFKMRKLLYVISNSSPFKPNISKLSSQTGISRNTVLYYLGHLHDARIVNLLRTEKEGTSQLKKPDKIYLNNSNLMYSLGRHNVNTGNLREAFFYNQLLVQHDVRMSKEADFWVDEKYTFEVGGKQKNQRQIHQLTDAYIAADGIEYGHGNKIPLFLFGLMY